MRFIVLLSRAYFLLPIYNTWSGDFIPLYLLIMRIYVTHNWLDYSVATRKRNESSVDLNTGIINETTRMAILLDTTNKYHAFS